MQAEDDGTTPALVRIEAPGCSFAFFARDVIPDYPVILPDVGVAVTTGDDLRAYEQILQSVRAKGLKSNRERIDAEPEESFESAAAATRSVHAPIWLGISRDVRIFEFNQRGPMQVTDYIQPRFHGYGYFWPEPDKQLLPKRYGFVMGRGWGCTEQVHRRLDDGALPILVLERIDDDVRYEATLFAALEREVLSGKSVRGTHPLVADGLSPCHAFTESESERFGSLRDAEVFRDEETVLCGRVVATNTAQVPRYAFLKALHPVFGLYGSPGPHRHDSETGFGIDPDSGSVFGVSKLDGRAMPRPEMAVLVPPGESRVYEFFLPHRPISSERAATLSKRNHADLLDECRSFWKSKLEVAGKIRVPEKRIEDALRAGILHFDLTSYGLEPDGLLNGTNGTYSALGSETTTNILFLDSVGLPELARRNLEYFFEKQRENGLMQNFEGYMLETGAVLWCAGEHFRHTCDRGWVARLKPKIVKAADFLVKWRAEHKREELRESGFGLVPGRVADPVDEQRQFMLNGYSYLGLCRVAEMLAEIDPEQSRRYSAEAAAYREDIRTAFFQEMARGPVVPVGDGTWVPTVGPWVGANGPQGVLLDKEPRWSHGTFLVSDDVLGPMHLVFQEVIDPHEPAADTLLRSHSELYFSRNFSFSQPYYSRHPWVHLRRRETAQFLKAWYTGLASLADRETFTWWEHYFHVSVHKTHEEGNFLMQTRWMLWLEEGDQLSLLRGIPRKWMEDGKQIQLDRVVSYFGPLSLQVSSRLHEGKIEASIRCDSSRKPRRLEIRLPHPSGARASGVEGGKYDAAAEAVVIEDFRGSADVSLSFN